MIKRRVLVTISFSLLVIVLTTCLTWIVFLYAPIVHDKQGVNFTVREGASFQSVITDLKNQKILNYPFLFNLLIYIKGDAHRIKAGEYFFPKGTNPLRMLNQMITGTGLVHHSFTIIAGWNFNQVKNALKQEDKLRHTIDNLSDQEIMASIGQPNLNPEGQFFPDTYYFIGGSVDIKLLKVAFKAMREKLTSAWQARSANVPYKNSYEALIVASLIEKEARVNVERPLISGVIVNRLRLNMLLQIDPTVIYGMGAKYTGQIRKQDLSTDTPYNTYVRKGLPPTPIAMPGMESINAAMHPAINDYIYFVARGDGHHQFTKTLGEHHVAVTAAKNYRQDYFNYELLKSYLKKFM